MKLHLTSVTTKGVYEDGRPFTRTTQVNVLLRPGDTLDLQTSWDYNWAKEPDTLVAPETNKPQEYPLG